MPLVVMQLDRGVGEAAVVGESVTEHCTEFVDLAQLMRPVLPQDAWAYGGLEIHGVGRIVRPKSVNGPTKSVPFLLEEKAPVFWLDAPSKHGVERNPSIGSSTAFGDLLGQCEREAWITVLLRRFAGVERHKLCNVVQRAELGFENLLDDYKLL